MKKSLTIGSLKTVDVPRKPEDNAVVDRKSLSDPVVKQNISVDADIIYLLQKGVVYSVHPQPKISLLDSALNQGCHLDYKCKKGTCGKCKIKLLKGMDSITLPNEKELERLGDQLTTGYRLACQTYLR